MKRKISHWIIILAVFLCVHCAFGEDRDESLPLDYPESTEETLEEIEEETEGSEKTLSCTVIYYCDEEELQRLEVPQGSTLEEYIPEEKEGFAFIGWFTDRDLTTEMDFSQGLMEDLHLYGTWEEKPESREEIEKKDLLLENESEIPEDTGEDSLHLSQKGENTLYAEEGFSLGVEKWKLRNTTDRNLYMVTGGLTMKYINDPSHKVFCLQAWRQSGDQVHDFTAYEPSDPYIEFMNEKGEENWNHGEPNPLYELPHSQELQEKLSRINYLAWDCSEKNPKDYFFTQILLWEHLGWELREDENRDKAFYNEYDTWRQNIETELTDMEKGPDFSGDFVIKDVDGTYVATVLEGTHSYTFRDIHNQIWKYRQVLAQDAEVEVVDHQVSFRQLGQSPEATFTFFPQEAMGSSIIYWKNYFYQAFEHFKVSSPIEAKLRIRKITGSLTVHKKDGVTGAFLPGAKIGLYQRGGNLLKSLTTDDEGKAVFTELSTGEYYLQEIEPPEGYVHNTQKYSFTFDKVERKDQLLILENTPIRGKIEVTKTEGIHGKLLKGAIIGLYHEDGKLISSKETDSEGKVQFVGLKRGKYYLQEIKAPYRYLGSKVKYPVEIALNTTYHIPMKNYPAKGQILIYKKDRENQPISGAVFHVKNVGEVVTYEKRISTDHLGIAKTGELPLGEYCVVEESVPGPYILEGTPKNISLSYIDDSTPLVVEKLHLKNDKPKVDIQVVKKNSRTRQPVEGAVFQLLVKSTRKWIKTLTTDREGKAWAVDLPWQTYLLRESSFPSGYIPEEKEYLLQPVYINDRTPVIRIDQEIENTETTVEISKQDRKKKELPGGKFSLYDEENNLVEAWESGEAPHVIYGLHVGKTYKVKEISPPPGYGVGEELTFTVEGTSEIQRHVIINEETEINIYKEDGQGNLLEGVVFGLYDSKGNLIEEWQTEKKPHSIKRLPFGKYILREISTPEGYQPCEDQEITLDRESSKLEIHVANALLESTPIIIKTDDENIAMEGVTFAIYSLEGNLLYQGKTDQDGVLYCKKLPYGKYMLKEIFPLEGYEPMEDRVIELYQPEEEFFITNRRIHVKVVLKKIDKNSEEPLSGVSFQIKDEKERPVYQGRTDEKGEIVCYLPFGTYYVEETQAPKGYISQQEKRKLVIHQEKEVEMILPNEREKTPALPSTGGVFSYTTPFGILCLILAGVLLIIRKKRQ